MALGDKAVEKGFQRSGGEGGIRTPGTLSGTPVFKTGAINHSTTPPNFVAVRARLALTRQLLGGKIVRQIEKVLSQTKSHQASGQLLLTR